MPHVPRIRPFSGVLCLAATLVVLSLLPGTASGAVRAVSSGQAAASGPWGIGGEAGVPANAAANPNVSINSVSCPSAGNCSAVGTYQDSSGNTVGLLMTETAGTWARGVEAPLPANAATTSLFVNLFSVSCASAGNCSAVGGYQDNASSEEGQGLLLTETSGTWSQGVEVVLPGDAISAGQDVLLSSVSCPSAGNCIAAGGYLGGTGSGSSHGLTVTETAGTWSNGVEPALPANAAAEQDARLESVSCPSVGNCSAVGVYDDSSGHGQGLLLAETAGSWATGAEATLPANAGTKQSANLDSVSCASAGNCSAVGGYLDGSNEQELLLLTETAGSWATGVEATLPSNAAANPIAVLLSISCAAAGECAAVGNYRAGSDGEWPVLLTETDGAWADGTEAELPANAAAAPFGSGSLVSVSCASVGNCSAAGGYNVGFANGGTTGESLLVSETAGSWSTGTEVALPSNGGGSDGLTSVSCASAGECGAVGRYGVSPPATAQGLLVTTTSTPPQETLTVSVSFAGTVTSSPAGIDHCGSTCSSDFDIGSLVTLTATPATNVNFLGFSGGGCETIGPCRVVMNSDTLVTATFAPKSFLLTVQKSGNGSGSVRSDPGGIDCGSTCAAAFSEGPEVTLTATPNSGSTFTGWTGGGCSGTGGCQVLVDADTTVTATFAAKPKPPKCVAPKVKGKTLASARRAIKAHHCSVGKIAHARSRTVKKGRVISQKPKPGSRLNHGAKIALVVSKGR